MAPPRFADHVTTQAPPEECEGVTCDDGEEFVELEPCSQQFCHCSGGVPILDVRRIIL